jgi:hypothetical protein
MSIPLNKVSLLAINCYRLVGAVNSPHKDYNTTRNPAGVVEAVVTCSRRERLASLVFPLYSIGLTPIYSTYTIILGPKGFINTEGITMLYLS